jgi:hypothetical protein
MKEESIKISIELVGYEEFIEKLNKIKELLNDIKNTKIEVD